jgi:hypothetical protein
MNTTVGTRTRGTAPGRPARPPAGGAGRQPQARAAAPPARRVRPASRPARGRPQPPPRRQPVARPASRGPSGRPGTGAGTPARTPFVLLVLGLLGGGLICLLVINTTLAAASFRITALQRSDTALSRQEQALQQEVSTQEAPSSIERRAYQLGMRMQPVLNFIDLRTGRVMTQPAAPSGVPAVPGYTP